VAEPSIGDAEYGYLTTTGRVSGRPHTVEIWFVLDASTIYLMHEARPGGPLADWVRNLIRHPEVSIRLADRDAPEIPANARLVTAPSAEDRRARELLLAKYTSRWSGDLTSWGRNGVAVALELARPPDSPPP
jgi:hypothetical protein